MSKHFNSKDLLLEEVQLKLRYFTGEAAFELGSTVREVFQERFPNSSSIPFVIDITTAAGVTLFRAAFNGTSPDNELWLQKKRNTAIRFETSSLRFGKELAEKGRTLESKGLNPNEYALHGGAFPLRLEAAPNHSIAILTVSGLEQHQDHDVSVEGLRRYIQRNELQ